MICFILLGSFIYSQGQKQNFRQGLYSQSDHHGKKIIQLTSKADHDAKVEVRRKIYLLIRILLVIVFFFIFLYHMAATRRARMFFLISLVGILLIVLILALVFL